MKLAILSDFHLGYAQTTERAEDSFIQAGEAIQKALDEKVHAILIAGDMFDSRVPSQDVLGKAMQLFLISLTSQNQGVQIESAIGKDAQSIPKTALNGTPVIAIHGTHERRGKGLTNAVELLEKAGLLIHLHCNSIVLKLGDEKVAIHGMSGVPEKYARQVLETWAPRKVQNAKNILMLHQSVEPFIYSDEDHPTLKLGDFPQDYDLVINGHIHWSETKQLGTGKFVLPGSTLITQMRKIEAEKPKGFFIYENNELRFKELKRQRKFYYKKLSFEDAEPNEIVKQIESEISSLETAEPKPLVKISLAGTLKEGTSEEHLKLLRIEQEHHGKFLLSIDKGKLESSESIKRRDLVERLRQKQLSVDDMGQELLNKHLEALECPVQNSEELFNILAKGNPSVAYKYLKEIGGAL
ncbi:MAG: DNA repair exonuclease [archaeon]